MRKRSRKANNKIRLTEKKKQQHFFSGKMIGILLWLDSSDDYDYLHWLSLEDRREFLESSAYSISHLPTMTYLYHNIEIPSQQEFRRAVVENMTKKEQEKYIRLCNLRRYYHNLN